MTNHQIDQKDFLSLFSDTRFRYIHDVNKATMQGSDILDLSWNTKGYGVFFTVNGFPPTGKADETRLLSLNGSYVDFDVDVKLPQTEKDRLIQETLMQGLEAGIPTPTIINRTQKGAHLIWVYPAKLEPTPENIAKWRDVQNRLVHCFKGDKQCTDPSRVLRVPYTMHLKDPQNPFEITVMSYKPESRHTVDEMSKAIPRYSDEKIGGKKLSMDAVLAGLPVGQGLRHAGIAQVAGYYLRGARTPEKIEAARTALYAWDQEKNKSPERWEERKRELDNTFESILALEMAKPEKEQDDPFDSAEKQSQKMELMQLVISNPDIVLFRDNYGSGHAQVVVGGHKEIMSCKGLRFKQWLSYSYLEQYGSIADPNPLNTAIHAIESTAAFKGKEYQLHNRVAKVGNTVWLDLADERNRAVRITADGWNIFDEVPILFRRHVHQKEQVEPLRGGDIKDLFHFVNVINPEQRLLLLVYLVACFIPDFPHVLLYVYGPQGSAKSTLCRILRRLVDPSRTEIVHMPTNERDIQLQLSRHHLIVYDNVDGINDAISALLCIGVTGGSSSERLYFTNGEDFIFDFRLGIVLNGINISAVKADLLERSLLFGLQSLGDGERRDEGKIYEDFEIVQPKILGGILDVVVKTLAIRPSVTITDKPRMADFALWGVAIAQALGYTAEQFLNAYGDKIREQSEEALAESVEAAAVITLMQEREEWTGTASDLLNELSCINLEVGQDGQRQKTGSRHLPKQPQVLIRRLNELKPNLQKIGIAFTSGERRGGVRMVTIHKINKNSVQTVNIDLEIAITDTHQDDMGDIDDEKGEAIPF